MMLNRFGICFLLIALIGNTLIAQDVITGVDLPLVVVNRSNQAIPNSTKINATMIVVDNPTGLNSILEPNPSYNGGIGIETRGSSSLIFPKQSYSVETRASDGSNLNTELLGLPTENDWIFNGPYDDKTLIRNHLALDLARSMGNYAPRAVFCEMFLDTLINGSPNFDYRGVYVLLERVKQDNDRVDISILSPDEVDFPGGTNPDVTGGYIIAVDESTGFPGDGWSSSFAGQNRVLLFFNKHNTLKTGSTILRR